MGNFQLKNNYSMALVAQKCTDGKLSDNSAVSFVDIVELAADNTLLASMDRAKDWFDNPLPYVTSYNKHHDLGKFSYPEWYVIKGMSLTEGYDHIDCKTSYSVVQQAYDMLAPQLKKWRSLKAWNGLDLIELHDAIKHAAKLMWEGYVDPVYKHLPRSRCSIDLDYSDAEIYWLVNIACYAAMYFWEAFEFRRPDSWDERPNFSRHACIMARKLYTVAINLRNFIIIANKEDYVICL